MRLGLRWRRRALRLSEHLRVALAAFAELSIRDVRARADEFADAEEKYAGWLAKRRENRAHPADGLELEGYAPEVQSGDPAQRWRSLEHELRQRGFWEVGELDRAEQIRWAKRLNALSETLNRPTLGGLDRLRDLPRCDRLKETSHAEGGSFADVGRRFRGS